MLVGRKTLQTAATTGNGAALDMRALRESCDLVFQITGNGVISGGTIQCEESDDPNFAGTWAPIGGVINAAAGFQTVRAQGHFGAVRARFATNVTGGGTVTIVAVATTDD